LFSLRKGTTLTKGMFLNHLYGGMDEPELKIIDVFICKVRKKLQAASTISRLSGVAAMCCAIPLTRTWRRGRSGTSRNSMPSSLAAFVPAPHIAAAPCILHGPA